MTTKTKQPAASPGGGKRRKFPVIPVVIGVVLIGIIAVVVLTFEGDQVEDAHGEPVVTGSALPRFGGQGTADPSVGFEAPTVQGADFDGTEVLVEPDGRPKILLFLAHWCPFCQNEVPVVVSWVNGGNLPDNVDLIGITTSTDRLRPNYPPSVWLDNEGWTEPVIVDSGINVVAGSFGLNAFPFWVFLNGDGTVHSRMSGELGANQLTQIAQQLSATAGG